MVSLRLVVEMLGLPQFGQGFAEKNLRRMIQLAEVFPDQEIVVTLSRQLGWSDTDREIRARFDRQASATKQRPLPWSLPILMRKTVFFFLLCLVPPKTHACMGLVPRFDRARNPHAGLITSVIGCLT